jgi:hypothetical protein
MSDDGPPPDGNYVPEPAPPDDPWPEDHVPPVAPDVPLDPVDPIPVDPPAEQLYDVWEGSGSPLAWNKMNGPDYQGLTYEEVTNQCMTLEGYTSIASVPPNYISHHIGIAQGSGPPD